jgi:hypothetical protein
MLVMCMVLHVDQPELDEVGDIVCALYLVLTSQSWMRSTTCTDSNITFVMAVTASGTRVSSANVIKFPVGGVVKCCHGDAMFYLL